jgi:phosphatidylserine/phosphatidylglycerophosphate/cardiolipin synthase-like enzyme
MAKTKKQPGFFPKKSQVFKKTSLAGLIALIFYALFEVSQSTTSQTTYVPASNQPIELYSNQTGDDLTQLYVSTILEAKQSITFIIYALLDPQIVQALKEKSEAGIPVYIVSDARASPGLQQKLPQATVVRRVVEGQGLTHQKILIVDEQILLIGSANMTTDSLRVHGNLVVAMDNPGLAEALIAKAKSMDEDGGSTPLLHRETTVKNQHVELWVLPDDRKATDRIISLIQSARKTIKVAMFTWTRQDFTQELIQAAKRGVKVETVIDRYSGKGASAKIVKTLSQAGIPIRLSTGKGLLHHKFAYIDNEILINGSTNWTNNAFKSNDDVFLVIYPLTTQQQNKMNQLWDVLQRQSEKINKN